MARIKKEPDEVSLIESVKGEFASSGDELLEDAISIADIDEVLEKLERSSGVAGVETDEPLIEHDSSVTATDTDDEAMTDEIELDLSAGELDKTSDPVRVYMREMGVVPLRHSGVAVPELGCDYIQPNPPHCEPAGVGVPKDMETDRRFDPGDLGCFAH